MHDADKLDAIGAIGIARAFAYGGHEGQRLWAEAPPDYVESLSTRHEHTPVHEYHFKLRKIKERLRHVQRPAGGRGAPHVYGCLF